MKKKNRIFMALPVLLMLFLISTAMISGTFARYASEYAGQDTALVARWEFSGSIDEDADTNTVEIWDHDYAENIYVNTAGDPLIAPGVDGEFKVQLAYDSDVDAALTAGVENTGDAAGDVPIQYSLDAGFGTVCYSLDDLADLILQGLVADPGDTAVTLVAEDATDPEHVIPAYYKIANTGATLEAIEAEATIYWRWPYDVTEHTAAAPAPWAAAAAAAVPGDTEIDAANAADTAIGVASYGTTNLLNRDDYVLEITLTATQLQPLE